MQAVNKAGKEVLDRIATILSAKRTDHMKIDNTEGTYMAVHVEVVGHVRIGELMSVAHYYEQNGDLMRDPDMVFLHVTAEGGNGEWYPVSFRQDGAFGVDQESVVFEDDGSYRIRRRQQRQHAVFAGQWMKNIKHQQGLSARGCERMLAAA